MPRESRAKYTARAFKTGYLYEIWKEQKLSAPRFGCFAICQMADSSGLPQPPPGSSCCVQKHSGRSKSWPRSHVRHRSLLAQRGWSAPFAACPPDRLDQVRRGPPHMTTVATRQVPRAGLAPARTAASITAPPQTPGTTLIPGFDREPGKGGSADLLHLRLQCAAKSWNPELSTEMKKLKAAGKAAFAVMRNGV
jgi:hypothetical protein